VTFIWPLCRLTPQAAPVVPTVIIILPETCLKKHVYKHEWIRNLKLPDVICTENIRSILLASIGHQEAFKCMIRATEGLNCWIKILPVWFMICFWRKSSKEASKKQTERAIILANQVMSERTVKQTRHLSITSVLKPQPSAKMKHLTKQQEQLKPLLFSTAVVPGSVGDWSDADHSTKGQSPTSGWLNHWSINEMDWGCDVITNLPSSDKTTH